MTKYLKAIYGAVIAGLGATSAAYVQGHGHIDFQACIFIATATITALGVVWGVPNAAPYLADAAVSVSQLFQPAKPEPTDEPK